MSKIDSRRRVAAYLGVVFVLCFALLVTAKAQDPTSSAGNLARLMAGNERFVSGKLQTKDYLTERPQLAQGQHPYAIVVACADSRVSPEILFDESLGRLFVVRTAGHVVDPVALGSIEYAVEHLHVNLVLVLGHEGCGAVKATISGGEAPPNIKALLRRIKPAVDKTFSQGISEQEFLNAAIRENVRYQIQQAMFESEVLSDHVLEKKLAVVGGVYHLKTGNIEMVATDVAVARTPEKPNVADTHEQKSNPDHPTTIPVPQEKKPNTHPPAATATPQGHKTNTHHPAATEASKEQKTSPHRPAATETPKEQKTKPHTPARTEADQKHKTGEGHSTTNEGPQKDEQPKNLRAPSLVPIRFADRIRLAYEKKLDVMLRKTMLMRDERDRCITDNCLSIAAGEQVSVDNPLILSVMGRPQLKVRYNGRPCYILADPEAIEVMFR